MSSELSKLSIPRIPPNAKCVAGVWLPEGEERYAEALTGECRWSKRPIINGKAALGYRWIQRAVSMCTKRRVAVDVGAHVGFWSMWLVREFAHVHAFEPVPDLAAILPRNMGSQNYTLHNYALGEQAGHVTMTVPPEATGFSHIDVTGPQLRPDAVVVVMRTLDSFEIQEVDLLKIDVEGYEIQVLRGAEQTIRSCRPIIVIEQNGHEERYGEIRDSALALLESWGARQLRVMKGDYFLGWN